MSVSEQDHQSLEELLDGELPVEQADSLRRRLCDEPELSQLMDRLRTDRQMRAGIFATLEPSDAQVETLIGNVRRHVRKQELWAQRSRALRTISGLAAAIAMVFAAGWISGHRLQVGGAPLPGSSVATTQVPLRPISTPALTQSQTQSPPSLNPFPLVVGPRVGNRSFDIGSSGVTNVGFDNLPLPKDPNNELFNGPTANMISSERPSYKVVVIDPWGRIIDQQQFETQPDAEKFTQQLNRFQVRQQQLGAHRPGEGIMPVTDQP